MRWVSELSNGFFGRNVRLYMVAGLIIYGVVHFREPAMCVTNQTMKGSVISSSNSTQGGGALLIPGNHSAGSSSPLSNAPSALHPTESPLPVSTVPKIHNVLLMGQFNYDVGVSHVRHWVGRWSEVFSHIEVRGAFKNETLEALQQLGISAFFGGNERGGLYSPTKNVGDSLRSAERMGGILGVMFVHDDMMVNITSLVEQGFPWDSQEAICSLRSEGFSLTRDGLISVTRNGNTSKFDMSNFEGAFDMLSPPEAYWGWWTHILPGAFELAKDERFSQYFDKDGTFSFIPIARSDFLYVPTRFSSFFSPLADLMTEKKIFLESAFPVLVDEIRKKFNASVLELNLCQGEIAYIPRCLSDEVQQHLFHPIKMAGYVEFWDKCFDRLVLQQENVVIPAESWWDVRR